MDQIWTELAAPVDDNELEWRVQQCGKKSGKVWAILVPYVQNRAIQRRLDGVIGPASWQNIFNPVGGGTEHGLSCGIGIKCEDEWVWKFDGAPFTNIEAIKGGHSDSMKRAAVHWGIGRYLYEFPVVFATDIQDGYPKGKNRINIYSKKDDIRACCPAPKQDNILKDHPAQQTIPIDKPGITNDRLLKGESLVFFDDSSGMIEQRKHLLNTTELDRVTDESRKLYADWLKDAIAEREKWIAEIPALERVAYPATAAVTNARNKHLETAHLNKASWNRLRDYKLYLETKAT